MYHFHGIFHLQSHINSNQVQTYKFVLITSFFLQVHQDQLLSVSQDKTIRLTNISSKSEIQRFHCESEVWACCWNTDNPFLFYVGKYLKIIHCSFKNYLVNLKFISSLGTKRSQILIYDTRESSTEAQGLVEFPVQERRPIIGTYQHALKNITSSAFSKFV